MGVHDVILCTHFSAALLTDEFIRHAPSQIQDEPHPHFPMETVQLALLMVSNLSETARLACEPEFVVQRKFATRVTSGTDNSNVARQIDNIFCELFLNV
jgi:hypothetical protein